MTPAGDEHNGQGKSRLDRLEGLMELLIADHVKFSDEHNRLLTAQVLLTDAQTRTEKNIQSLQKKIEELAEAHASLCEEYAIRADYRAAWRHARFAEQYGQPRGVELLTRYRIPEE